MAELKTLYRILGLVDIVNYTSQANKLGDKYTAQYTQYFQEKIESIVTKHGFQLFKFLGDAALFQGEDTAGLLDIMRDLFHGDKPEDKFGFTSKFRLVAHSGYFQFLVENKRIKDLVSPEGIKVFRLEKEARAWELVVTQALFQGLKPLLTQKNMEANRLQLKESLKGFDNEEWFPPFYKLTIAKKGTGAANLLEQRQDELRQDVREIPVFGKIYQPVPMESNFINLSLKSTVKPDDSCLPAGGEKEEEDDDLPLQRKRSRNKSDRDEWLDSMLEKDSAKENPDIDVPTLYDKYCRGIIIGLPGAGKTTILRHIAFLEFKTKTKRIQKKKRLVLFVPCRDIPFFDAWLQKQNIDTGGELECDAVLEYLTWVFLFGTRDYHDITPEQMVEFQAAHQKIKKAYSENRLTLLLDALDEAPDKEAKERIKELFSKLIDCPEPGNRIYLTSRPSEYFSPRETTAPLFYVRNLDMEQMRKIAKHLMKEDSADYKLFDTALWQEEVVVKMAATPITALLITAYFQAYGRFQHRFPMYDLLVKFILLKVWDAVKKDKLPFRNLEYFFDAAKQPDFLKKHPQAAILYDALGALCFDLFYDSATGNILRSAPEETILKYFIDFIEDNRYMLDQVESPVLAGQWLERFHADHLMLRSGKSEYVFVHSTVMEYLAAFHLVGLLKKDPERYALKLDRCLATIDLLELETIPLAAGSDLSGGFLILSRIRDLKAAYDRQYLVELGVDCLAEIEWQITKTFQSIQIEKLRGPIRKLVRDNRPAVDWLYTYLKDIVLSTDKERLRWALDRLEPVIKLSQQTFLDEFLDQKSFAVGDAELVGLRREFLAQIIQKDVLGQWFTKLEQDRQIRNNIVVYDNVLQLDTLGYHPEDKNFNYYRRTIGSELTGFFGSPNLKHSNSVTCVAFSPDEKFIISGSYDFTLRLWYTASGKEMCAFTGHGGPVRSTAFSPNGKCLVSGSDDRTLRLWDAATGKEVSIVVGHNGAVWSAAFSPDGKYLLSGSDDQILRLWDRETGNEVRTFKGHSGPVRSAAFSRDGNFIISGSVDQTLRLWEAATGKELHAFKGHDGWISCVAFSSDGEYLVSGSSDQTLRLWGKKTGKEVRTFKGLGSPVTSVAFLPDGNFFFSSSLDYTLRLWDVSTGQQVRDYTNSWGWVSSMALSTDGKLLVAGSYDNTLHLLEVVTGEAVRAFTGHRGRVWSAVFSLDGKYLLSGSEDRTLRLWEANTGKEVHTFSGHFGAVRSAVFSPDGKLLISGSEDRTLRLWETATGKEVRVFKGHNGWVWSTAFSSDGKYLISGSADSTLRLWETDTGKEMRTIAGHGGPVWDVAFSSDGKLIISSSEDKTLRLWDTETGEEIRAFTGHEDFVWSAAFSSDEKFILSGSTDRTLRLWEVASGQEVRVFYGHNGSVFSAVFSPNGKLLISCSDDRTIRLWSPETGECIHTIKLPWTPYDIKAHPRQPGIYAAACGNGVVILLYLSAHL